MFVYVFYYFTQQHNLLSLEATAHQTMQEILISKAPSITGQSTTTDELNVTEK